MKIKHGERGFHITTDSGYVLSVQYGSGNYCQNQNSPFDATGDDLPESRDCEIAIWKDDGNLRSPMIEINGSQVTGWVPMELIPQIMLDLQADRFESVCHALETMHEDE